MREEEDVGIEEEAEESKGWMFSSWILLIGVSLLLVMMSLNFAKLQKFSLEEYDRMEVDLAWITEHVVKIPPLFFLALTLTLLCLLFFYQITTKRKKFLLLVYITCFLLVAGLIGLSSKALRLPMERLSEIMLAPIDREKVGR